jgi:hypothetical protein
MEAVIRKERLYDRMTKTMHYWLPLFAYCSLIFCLSSSSKPPVTASLCWGGGKPLHMAEYTILGFLAARAIFSLKLRSSDEFVFALSVMFCILYGLSDEIHQSFTPGRSPNLGDVMADGVGALIGAFSYWLVLTRSWSGAEKGR